MFSDGLINESVQPLFSIHITIALLIVIGGLGFTTVQEIFQRFNFLGIFKVKRTSISTQSKLAVNCSAILIIVGAMFFYLFEQEKTLQQQTLSIHEQSFKLIPYTNFQNKQNHKYCIFQIHRA